jgi:hypothetical protein
MVTVGSDGRKNLAMGDLQLLRELGKSKDGAHYVVTRWGAVANERFAASGNLFKSWSTVLGATEMQVNVFVFSEKDVREVRVRDTGYIEIHLA